MNNNTYSTEVKILQNNTTKEIYKQYGNTDFADTTFLYNPYNP